MSNPKTISPDPTRGELVSLLVRLSEEKTQLERLLGEVDDILRRASFGGKTFHSEVAVGAAPTPRARKSPLDQMKAVMESTAGLREANGNLSAARIAKLFGLSLTQLAGWLGRTKQALSKTPDADSLQESLGYFERVARLRMITNGDAGFRKWLRTPHEILGNAPPLELLAKREWQQLADYVEDILTGSPG